MDDNQSGGAAKFAFGNKPEGTNVKQGDTTSSPVEEESLSAVADFVKDANQDKGEDLDLPYVDESSITISLVKNFSLYRKANDKVLPKKKDFIGGSVSASRILSSSQGEVEVYFPPIIGLAANNVDFIARVKQYLNNIRVGVDELGKTLNTSFKYDRKADYYKIVAEEERIESDFLKVDRRDLSKIKAALKVRIERINALEASKYKYGRPVEIEEYLIYRHCMLYSDVAKDLALINSDSSIRFYFKDNQKEADKARKFRVQVNKAKMNYVTILQDDALFDSIYTQYLVFREYPVISGLLEDKMDREIKLDKFSSDEPIKFNELCTNKDVKLIGSIELLIAHGELQRSKFNQNITDADGNFIGGNIKEAVSWFKNPDNNSVIDAYFNKLKNI